jgi:hypothetical protein
VQYRNRIKSTDSTSNLLVEWHGGAKKGVDDIRIVVQLLVHHKRQDAHLGGTAVIQLYSCLCCLLVCRPSKAVHVVVAVLLNGLLNSAEAILNCTDEKKLGKERRDSDGIRARREQMSDESEDI